MNITNRHKNLEKIASKFTTPIHIIPDLIEALNDNDFTDIGLRKHFNRILKQPFNFASGDIMADSYLEKNFKARVRKLAK